MTTGGSRSGQSWSSPKLRFSCCWATSRSGGSCGRSSPRSPGCPTSVLGLSTTAAFTTSPSTCSGSEFCPWPIRGRRVDLVLIREIGVQPMGGGSARSRPDLLGDSPWRSGDSVQKKEIGSRAPPMGAYWLSGTIQGVFGNRSNSPFSEVRRARIGSSPAGRLDYFRIAVIRENRPAICVSARLREVGVFGIPGSASIAGQG